MDAALWKEEAAGIEAFYEKFGKKLPQELRGWLETLRRKLAEAE